MLPVGGKASQWVRAHFVHARRSEPSLLPHGSGLFCISLLALSALTLEDHLDERTEKNEKIPESHPGCLWRDFKSSVWEDSREEKEGCD